MPTGYTDCIADDVTFEQFTMRCARAFGALIHMRDDPMGAPIPQTIEPSKWSGIQAEKAEKRLAELQSLSPGDAEREAEIAYQRAVESREESARVRRGLKDKYEAMLAQVEQWTPPSPDHEKLKKFMVEQITESIDFDCDIAWLYRESIVAQAGEEWRAAEIARALRDMEYHTKQQEEENQRAADRTRWVQRLRESLMDKEYKHK
jgi:hypothetical protein